MFAAVGTDGLRPVVWGIGETEDAAREDARQWLTPGLGHVSELEVHPITAAQARAIEAGDVSWPAKEVVDELPAGLVVGYLSEESR